MPFSPRHAEQDFDAQVSRGVVSPKITGGGQPFVDAEGSPTAGRRADEQTSPGKTAQRKQHAREGPAPALQLPTPLPHSLTPDARLVLSPSPEKEERIAQARNLREKREQRRGGRAAGFPFQRVPTPSRTGAGSMARKMAAMVGTESAAGKKLAAAARASKTRWLRSTHQMDYRPPVDGKKYGWVGSRVGEPGVAVANKNEPRACGVYRRGVDTDRNNRSAGVGTTFREDKNVAPRTIYY